jgi:pilus assembly protein FimV
LIAKSHRWQKTAIAATAIALLSLTGTQALALSLGRITVLSALGEPLRAEIEVPDINDEEAATLQAKVAAPSVFTANGLEYNAALTSLSATLERRADGRSFIRLSSPKPVNDPFVDVILETTWSAGRIVRDYTMLFDPPVTRKAQATPTLPQTAPAASVEARPAPAPAPVSEPIASAPVEPAPRAAAPTPAPAPTAKSVAKDPTPVAVQGKPAADPTAKSVTVKAGDTAGKIANAVKPAGVSLDQMLVAMLRANPDAFVKDNINRIRAGAVLDVPSADQANALSPAEATQIVVAQSKDFNEFRRNLAGSAPVATVAPADRQASGKVEAKVEEKKPAAPAPDKLTLSKGSVQSKTDEAKIAKERADKDAAARAAEINKNINDLGKIGAAATPATPAPAKPAPAPATPAPSLPVAAAPAPVPPAPAAPAPAPAAAAPEAPAPAPAAPAPEPKVEAPAPAAPKPMAPVKTAPVEEPDFLAELLDNPIVPAAAAGLVALLAGFGVYRLRKSRKDASHVDSSFLESRLQPDSFFGASGGQRVDTNSTNDGASASSMVYSASQLDAADDVDPVAEADVYLAYGRDLQAEEILKEAVRTNPSRLAIHTKLLEIFAKRRDAKSFESAATQAYRIAGAASPEWARMCELGLSIDPNNPLYKPGGVPDDLGAQAAAAPAPAPEKASSFGSPSTVPVAAPVAKAPTPAPAPAPAASGVDLDLDLDFSLDEEPRSAISDVTGGTMTSQQAVSTVKLKSSGNSRPAPLAPEPTPEISLTMDGVSLTDEDPEPSLKFEASGPAPLSPSGAVVQPAAANNNGMLEFDLGSLSLDLDSSTSAHSESPTEAPNNMTEDPLETKLALAEEFVSIGDEDGARALIEEVIAESSGDMRAKAQRALANLS